MKFHLPELQLPLDPYGHSCSDCCHQAPLTFLHDAGSHEPTASHDLEGIIPNLANINTDHQSFFSNCCNFCILCVILHFRYLLVINKIFVSKQLLILHRGIYIFTLFLVEPPYLFVNNQALNILSCFALYFNDKRPADRLSLPIGLCNTKKLSFQFQQPSFRQYIPVYKLCFRFICIWLFTSSFFTICSLSRKAISACPVACCGAC